MDDAASNIVAVASTNDPTVGLYFGSYLVGLIQASVNLDYGISWIGGVLLIIVGFLILILSDRKKETVSDTASKQEPLLPKIQSARPAN